jgi:hypothetical protein
VADTQVESARERLGSAQNRVNAANAQQAYYDATQAKIDWEGKRDEIKAAVEERKKVVGTVVDIGKSIATGGTQGHAIDQGAELIKTVVGGMTDAELKQLVAAESNIEQYSEVMKKASARVLGEQTAAAQKDLKAASLDFKAAQQTAVNTEAAQERVLHELATLEKQHKTGTIFQELERTNEQVRPVAAEVRQLNEAYQRTLRNAPLGNAAELERRVTEDIQHARTYYNTTEDWLDRANGTEQYLNRLKQWQQGEMASSKQLEQDLGNSQHLNIINETMDAIDLAQGGNPRGDGMVRPTPTR